MSETKPSRPVILCLGNADRGDDAQGPCCADLLSRRSIPVEIMAGKAFELLEYFRVHPHVIIVDAVVTGSHPPGHIHRFDGTPTEIAPFAGACSTHGFGLGEALRLGGVLKALPERLTIFGIESQSFDWGSTPTPAVASAMESLAGLVEEEWLRASG